MTEVSVSSHSCFCFVLQTGFTITEVQKKQAMLNASKSHPTGKPKGEFQLFCQVDLSFLSLLYTGDPGYSVETEIMCHVWSLFICSQARVWPCLCCVSLLPYCPGTALALQHLLALRTPSLLHPKTSKCLRFSEPSGPLAPRATLTSPLLPEGPQRRQGRGVRVPPGVLRRAISWVSSQSREPIE